MKKQVSSQYTQLTLDFEFESTTSAPVQQSHRVEYHLTPAEFEECQAIEHDIMYGRGAYLYKQVERELAFQRKQAQILKQFEAMRASIYQ